MISSCILSKRQKWILRNTSWGNFQSGSPRWRIWIDRLGSANGKRSMKVFATLMRRNPNPFRNGNSRYLHPLQILLRPDCRICPCYCILCLELIGYLNCGPGSSHYHSRRTVSCWSIWHFPGLQCRFFHNPDLGRDFSFPWWWSVDRAGVCKKDHAYRPVEQSCIPWNVFR